MSKYNNFTKGMSNESLMRNVQCVLNMVMSSGVVSASVRVEVSDRVDLVAEISDQAQTNDIEYTVVHSSSGRTMFNSSVASDVYDYLEKAIGGNSHE